MAGRPGDSVRGIVLAGVHRWSDSSFEMAVPRPLVPIGHVPLICYVLSWLGAAGVKRATVCANGDSRRIRTTLGDGGGLTVDLDYYEDWTPRGPAGCVRDAAQHGPADLFVVADSTIIPQIDLGRLLQTHRERDAAVTVVTAWNEGLARSSAAAPVGVYVFSAGALPHIPAAGYQDIKEVLIPLLVARGRKVETYAAEGPCPRVTDTHSYLAVNEWLLEQAAAQACLSQNGGFGDSGNARPLVDPAAQVSREATLIGPVLISPGAVVERGAIIVGPASIGRDCHVFSGAVVSRSVLWERCAVGVQAMVDQSLLIQGTQIKAGAWLFGGETITPHRHGLPLLSRWLPKPAGPGGSLRQPATVASRVRPTWAGNPAGWGSLATPGPRS
jgi:mannose-1-phosphate guanylyltransferase